MKSENISNASRLRHCKNHQISMKRENFTLTNINEDLSKISKNQFMKIRRNRHVRSRNSRVRVQTIENKHKFNEK